MLLLTGLPFGLFAEPTLEGTPAELKNFLLDDHKIISIYGSSEVEASADKAVVTLLVKTSESRLRRALDKNRRIRQSIQTVLVEKGIPAENIQFSRFSNTPNYGLFSDKPSSYEISNEVKINISREESLSDIATIVDSKAEVYFVGSGVEHTLREQFKQQALKEAVQNARAKQNLYEKQLGLKLKPVKVTEHSVDVIPLHEVEKPRTKLYSSALQSTGETRRHFGEVKYRASVEVEFIAR